MSVRRDDTCRRNVSHVYIYGRNSQQMQTLISELNIKLYTNIRYKERKTKEIYLKAYLKEIHNLWCMYVGEEKNESMTSDKHKENAFHKIFLSTHSFSYILWYFVICS